MYNSQMELFTTSGRGLASEVLKENVKLIQLIVLIIFDQKPY